MNQPRAIKAQSAEKNNAGVSVQGIIDISADGDYSIHQAALLCTNRYPAGKYARAAGAAKEFLQSEIDGYIPWVSVGGMLFLVLPAEKRNNHSLVIAKDIFIEDMPYHGPGGIVTWEQCTLRKWLNTVYYESLPPDIKKRIVEVTLENPNNSQYGTAGGNGTHDKVFLLSLDEVRRYFKDNDARIATNMKEGVEWWLKGQGDEWWLRSPGDCSLRAAIVLASGFVRDDGDFVKSYYYGVRPAFWLNLDS